MTDADLEDYIAWRIHMSVVGYLGDDWRETKKNFDEVVSGTVEQERWRTCSDAANRNERYNFNQFKLKHII